MVWTGGKTNNPGNTVTEDWRWLYTTDYNGPHVNFLYDGWDKSEPNNKDGKQYTMAASKNKAYNFGDANLEYPGENDVFCYICECDNK